LQGYLVGNNYLKNTLNPIDSQRGNFEEISFWNGPGFQARIEDLIRNIRFLERTLKKRLQKEVRIFSRSCRSQGEFETFTYRE